MSRHDPPQVNNPDARLAQRLQELQREISQLELHSTLEWKALTLKNGWVVSSQSPQYAKDRMGFVHLRGRLKVSATHIAFELPETYQPRSGPDLISIAGYDGTAATAAFIVPAPSTEIYYAAGTTEISMMGVSFYAER